MQPPTFIHLSELLRLLEETVQRTVCRTCVTYFGGGGVVLSVSGGGVTIILFRISTHTMTFLNTLYAAVNYTAQTMFTCTLREMDLINNSRVTEFLEPVVNALATGLKPLATG